jgi:diadenosine tetraphosphate (Ap4A) HIT family hydrolase
MACCDIWTAFDEKHLLLKEYAHWKLLVRNRNTTLGNCVAITKRHMERFSDIRPDEMAEFALVVKDIEGALEKSFKPDKMNYLMLMMKDKHTHFHIVPRYASTRDFAGIPWTDIDWPGPTKTKPADASGDVLQTVREELQRHL